MGIYYGAGLFYGKIKKSTDFKEEDLKEYGFSEMLEEFCSKYEDIGFAVLGYDSAYEAIVGRSLATTDYYGQANTITQEGMDKVDAQLGSGCQMLCYVSIT